MIKSVDVERARAIEAGGSLTQQTEGRTAECNIQQQRSNVSSQFTSGTLAGSAGNGGCWTMRLVGATAATDGGGGAATIGTVLRTG
jgi:hypothetical protein